METLTPGGFMVLLGRDSLQAGMLVLVVLLAQWLLGSRLTARWRSTLWLLVMARLLLPVSVHSVVSVFNLLPKNPSPMMAAVSPTQPSKQTAGGETATAALVAPPPATIEREVAEPNADLKKAGNDDAGGQKTPTAPVVKAAPQAPVKDSTRISWERIIFSAWLGGVVVLSIYVMAGSLRASRRFARLAPMTDGSLLRLLAECQERLGVRSRLSLAESPDMATPALHGFIRPRLLLPAGFAARFSMQELQFILLHELAHVKRRDILLNWLAALLQIMHWFNPLIWFGFARWRADRELACDALALETAGGNQNQAYGQTILRLLENFSRRAAVPGLVGILEDKNQLRQRIKMIAGFRASQKLGWITAALLAVLVIVCLTDARLPKAGKSSGDTVQTNGVREVRHGADPVPTADGKKLPAQLLTVTVVDAVTGQSLADAEVSAPYAGNFLDPEPQRLTDGQGRYVLQVANPPVGMRRDQSLFTVSANHEGYAGRSAGWTSSSGNVEATLPKEVTIKLEPGITIGGGVRDEHGQPLAGVRVLLSGSDYSGFRMGTDEKKTHDYSEIYQTDKEHPAAMTSADGRWSFAHFPPDLETFEVTFVRPDDSRYDYNAGQREYGLDNHPPILLPDLRTTNADTMLPDGITVRGIVVDENGKPIPGATVEEGYGSGNIVRISEFKTDADGRFERLNRAARQWIYTATADNRATASVVAQVESNMPDVKLVLPPAKPLPIRVTDAGGRPVAGVRIEIFSYRNEGQILDWKPLTDANGMAVWTNAPTMPVTFYAWSKSLGISKQFKAGAADGEKTLVLDKNAGQRATVQVRAVDSETAQPVTMRSIAVEYAGKFTFKTLSEPKAARANIEIKATDFQVGMAPQYQVKIEAEGYEPFITDYIDLGEGDENLVATMIRGEPADGVALLPNGQPAANARIWVRPTDDAGALFINAPGRYYGDRLAKTNADENGNFSLPEVAGNQPVIFVNSNGFLETTVDEIKRTHRAQLQPWGRVEGVLKIAGKPKGGVSVSLNTLQWSPEAGFNLGYMTSTKPDGSFVFEQVPAGEYKLYRTLEMRSGRVITENHQLPLAVKAGETAEIEYSNAGREILGQAASDNPNLAVDWLNDDDTLTLKQAAVSELNYEDFASNQAFQEARKKAYKSPARLAQVRAARTYVLDFDQDGSFRAEDVPPGNYELSIRVTKPDPGNHPSPFGQGEELGSLTREIVVPEGDSPFDLGTLTLAMKGGSGGPKPAPVNFTATKLDGSPLALAQFKGKYVVLVFWATWSDRSAEGLKELQKLQKTLGNDPRVTFLGVSLDNDADAVAKEVESRGYPWTQATLESTNLAKVTATLGISSLPAIYLIDPEGRVIARDLSGDRLVASVQRALK